MAEYYIKNYFPQGFNFSNTNISSLPALKKIQDFSIEGTEEKPTEDDYIRAGYEILNIILLCFEQIQEIYPKMKELNIHSVDQLIPKGTISVGSVMGASVHEEVKKKFGENFTKEKYIPIHIPTQMTGSGLYVIFEIPNTNEEIPQRPPIELTK